MRKTAAGKVRAAQWKAQKRAIKSARVTVASGGLGFPRSVATAFAGGAVESLAGKAAAAKVTNSLNARVAKRSAGRIGAANRVLRKHGVTADPRSGYGSQPRDGHGRWT